MKELVEKYLTEGLFRKDPIKEGDWVEILKSVKKDKTMEGIDRENLINRIGQRAYVDWQNVKGLTLLLVFADGDEIDFVPQKVLKKVDK